VILELTQNENAKMKAINRQLLQMTRVGGSIINQKVHEVDESNEVTSAD
jgi:hypothetical protein